MNKKEPSEAYTLAKAREDIRKLNDERIAQLNRIVATEAMIKTALEEIPTALLQVMEERYDVRKVNAMEHMLPGSYRPHLWDHYTEKMRELIALRRDTPPTTPP